MIITIDGPAGAGKSTVARRLARQLGFRFLDTGAMYRAIAWLSIKKRIDTASREAFQEMLDNLRIDIDEDGIKINDQDVTEAILRSEVTARVSAIADQLAVRSRLVQQQREIAAEGNYVCEGRDQGSVVFPESRCKFFLTASAAERARRRASDLNRDGEIVTEAEILRQQLERDFRDESRPVGRLVKAGDAIEVITDGMTLDQVADKLESIARKRLKI